MSENGFKQTSYLIQFFFSKVLTEYYIRIYNIGVPIRVPKLQNRAARNAQLVHILLNDYFLFFITKLCVFMFPVQLSLECMVLFR